jgi:hypothetical protein
MIILFLLTKCYNTVNFTLDLAPKYFTFRCSASLAVCYVVLAVEMSITHTSSATTPHLCIPLYHVILLL